MLIAHVRPDLSKTHGRWHGLAMQEDRERGQIISTRVKRQRAFEHAKAMLPHIQQAQVEISSDGQSITLRRIADWLNARNLKTQRGKVFRPQTVDTLLNPEIGQTKAAEAEYGRELAILKWKRRLLTEADALATADRHQEALRALRDARDRTIAEAKALGHAMRLGGRFAAVC